MTMPGGTNRSWRRNPSQSESSISQVPIRSSKSQQVDPQFSDHNILPLYKARGMASSMSSKSSTQVAHRQSKTWQVRKQQYLILYNLVSGFLWFVVLARTVSILSIGGPKYVHEEVGEFTKWTQSLALLEIVHSAVGE